MALVTAFTVYAKRVASETDGQLAPRSLEDIRADKWDNASESKIPKSKTHEHVDFVEPFEPEVDHDARQWLDLNVYPREAWGKVEPGKKYRIEIHSVED